MWSDFLHFASHIHDRTSEANFSREYFTSKSAIQCPPKTQINQVLWVFGGIGFAFTSVIFSFASFSTTDPSIGNTRLLSLTAQREGSHKRRFTIVTTVTLPREHYDRRLSQFERGNANRWPPHRLVSPRRASFCHAAPAPAHGASGYICNPRILSSFPAVSRAGQVCTRKRNGLHSRPTARLYLLQRADYTCKKSCEKRRAQIPRYRLINEGVATTRKPTRKPKCVFRTQSKFSKC